MGATRRIALSALAAITTVLLVSGPAQAHTQLVGVDPGEGSTVAAGDTVTLTFSSALLDLGTEASVTDSSGATTAAAVDLTEANTLLVTIPEVAGGDITLAWRIVAEDGHPIEGTTAFVAEAPPAPEPAEPSAQPSASAVAEPGVTEPDVTASEEPSASPTVSAGSADNDDNSNSGMSVALWVAIAVALAAALFGSLSAARRRAGGAGGAGANGADATRSADSPDTDKN